MDLKSAIMVTTITEKCKEESGNKDGFYDGEWRVVELDQRCQEVELVKNGVAIWKKFHEINAITIKEGV